LAQLQNKALVVRCLQRLVDDAGPGHAHSSIGLGVVCQSLPHWASAGRIAEARHSQCIEPGYAQACCLVVMLLLLLSHCLYTAEDETVVLDGLVVQW